MIGQIVERYRAKLRSYRKFADDLNGYLRPHAELSHAAIHLWERDKASPDYFMLVYLANRSGWPADMAREMLHEIKPE